MRLNGLIRGLHYVDELLYLSLVHFWAALVHALKLRLQHLVLCEVLLANTVEHLLRDLLALVLRHVYEVAVVSSRASVWAVIVLARHRSVVLRKRG